ncbi:hypothetical protein SPHV1_360013 [Novosphingobium sp. KN65.2]|nr:hypothetical protein SPHV1_360013 [Novosphingobium sp. KN65.2]
MNLILTNSPDVEDNYSGISRGLQSHG